MDRQKLVEDVSARIRELLARTPAQDLESNMRAMLGSVFARLDLVTRQEFDVQAEVLRRTREKLAQLEAKLSALEKSGPAS